MANDSFRTLRSTVPLLRPKDRCPGEIYVNFADKIVGYIDNDGNPQDTGPFVFPTVADLQAFSAATTPRDGILAFAADDFYLSRTGEVSVPGLPGWRQIQFGEASDLDEILRLIDTERTSRVAGDVALGASIDEERTARIGGDNALAQVITTLDARVTGEVSDANARITQESTVRAGADSALAQQIDILSSVVSDGEQVLNARITDESVARVAGDEALASRSTTLEASVIEVRTGGGNLIDNALLTNDTSGWQHLSTTQRVSRTNAPAGYVWEIGSFMSSSTLIANNNQFRPLTVQTLELTVWVRRNAGASMSLRFKLEQSNAIGQPRVTIELDITPSVGQADQWVKFTKSCVFASDSSQWRAKFAAADYVSGTFEIAAPFLGIRGADVSGDLAALSARITDESVARVAGDTALASRSTALEATTTIQKTRFGSSLIESFDRYETEAEARSQINFGSAQPTILTLVTTPDSGGKGALIAPVQAGLLGLNTIPITPERRYRMFIDVEAVGGSVSFAAGAVARSNTGGRLFATSGGRDHVALTESTSLAAGQRLQLVGFLGGSAAQNAPGMGQPARNIDTPHPWVVGTATASWTISTFNMVGSLLVHSIELVEVTASAAFRSELSSRISTEEIARVAGDTALASRTTVLEVSSRELDWVESFSTYTTIEEVEKRWQLLGARSDFLLVADGNAVGGRALRTAFTSNIYKEIRGRLELAMPYDQDALYEITASVFTTAGLGTADIYLGIMPLDANRAYVGVSDSGTFAYPGGVYINTPPNTFLRMRGYFRGRAAVGAGNGVGAPAADINFPSPLPNGTLFIVPVVLPYNTQTGGGQVTILDVAVRRLDSTTTSLSARITAESQARVTSDEALASQIQKIIAEGVEGALTFRQPNAPANPEIGWLWWDSDNSDKLYRWDGTGWFELVDQRVPGALASIEEERLARISGDNALASQTAILSARVTNTEQGVTDNTNRFTSVNARVASEEIARANGDSALGTRVDSTNAALTTTTNRVGTNETSITQVNARVTAEEQARVAADTALASRLTVTEATTSSNAAGISTVSARVTTEEQARIAGDNALASRATTTETNVGNLSAKVTENAQSIGGIEARWGVFTEANGDVGGIELLNGANGRQFIVRTDSFLFRNSEAVGDNALPVFEIVDGRVFIRNALIGLLSADQIGIDGITLDTDDQGRLTIKQQGVTSQLLARNAAVKPFTKSLRGSWSVPTKNVWVNAQSGGQVASLATVNPVGVTGFFDLTVVVLSSNAGSDDDEMSFRIQRNDGLILAQTYETVNIGETFNRNQSDTFHFFDEPVLSGATFTYTLQVRSNDFTPIRAITMLGKMFSNASSVA